MRRSPAEKNIPGVLRTQDPGHPYICPSDNHTQMGRFCKLPAEHLGIIRKIPFCPPQNAIEDHAVPRHEVQSVFLAICAEPCGTQYSDKDSCVENMTYECYNEAD